MRSVRMWLLVLGFGASVGFGAACSTGAAAGGSNAGIVAALNNIDGVGFHAIDDAIGKPGAKIDASWLGKVRNARIAVAATTWPKDLQTQSKAFLDASATLQTALDKDDAAGAAKPARDAHEAQHTLSADAYNYLAKASGIATPHPAGH
ncbi:MAG: hypothetical protein U0360_00925 [Dehalococcoidia bacterium]